MNTIETRPNWVLTAVLLLLSILTIFSILYMVLIIALKTPDQMIRLLTPPTHIRWKNFADAWVMTQYPRKFFNTFLITLLNVFFTLITNSTVAFAISRNKEKSKLFNFFYYLFISAMFIPFQVLMLPLVKQANLFHLDSTWGIIFLYVVFGLPMNVFLYSGFIKTIPEAIDEAALIDGANPFQVFTQIIFPLMKPMHSTVAILSVLWSWNDFLMPLVLLTKEKYQTLQLSQYVFQTQFSTDYNLAFASYAMALIPVIIVYVFCQKYIISGVTKGAIK